MTLKMYLTPDIEKLACLVENSHGDVLLRLSGNSLCSLKHDAAAASCLKREADKCRGMEIHLSDTKDYFKFVNFIMGGCV